MKPALIYYKENVFSQLDYFQNIRLALPDTLLMKDFI